jgi:hypothetical protein
MDAREDFAPAQKPLFAREIKAAGLLHPAQGESLSLLVRGQPDFSHASAVNELLQIKAAEGAGLRRDCGAEIELFRLGHGRPVM